MQEQIPETSENFGLLEEYGGMTNTTVTQKLESENKLYSVQNEEESLTVPGQLEYTDGEDHIAVTLEEENDGDLTYVLQNLEKAQKEGPVFEEIGRVEIGAEEAYQMMMKPGEEIASAFEKYREEL